MLSASINKARWSSSGAYRHPIRERTCSNHGFNTPLKLTICRLRDLFRLGIDSTLTVSAALQIIHQNHADGHRSYPALGTQVGPLLRVQSPQIERETYK